MLIKSLSAKDHCDKLVATNNKILPDQSCLCFKSILNFRDLGGTISSGGRQIKKGIVFRSANPDNISSKEINKLYKLNIRTIIDLRSPLESQNRNRKFDKIETLSLPLDFEQVTRERLMPYFYKKNSYRIIEEIANSLYQEILDTAMAVFRKVVEVIIDPALRPVLIHCQAGKDRTGVICALLHLALGAEREYIINDYMSSNDALLPFYRRKLKIRKFISIGLFPADTILYAITVRESNIESVIDRVNGYYGGIYSYLESSGFNMSQFSQFQDGLLKS